MIKRKVRVVESDWAVRMLTAFQRRIPKSDVWIPLNESGHFRWKEWNSAPPQLALNEQELRRGKLLLKEMGTSENEPIVWDYHRYRNTKIENYLKAVEGLTAKGYWALRMGAIVERPLTAVIPRVIDYASTCRSDFMDVFLLSYCKFYVGDTGGPISFPNAFNIPVVMTNSIPLASVARNKNALTIPKKHMDKQTGRMLTFREIISRGMDRWSLMKYFDEAGIELVENTPEEISDVVMEMHLRLEGQWQGSKEDERLQERFRSIIPEGHPLKGFLCKIGASFLRNNQELLA